MSSFDEWFKRAAGDKPYPFQIRFASEPGLLSLLSHSRRSRGEGVSVDMRIALCLHRGQEVLCMRVI
jgi:hypothetical protein